MIHRDDVTFIAAAANTGALANADVAWSSYNALAVRGDQSGFDPTGSPGKTHADLGDFGAPSFITARVSGFAAGLYGTAQTASQTNALHGVVMRSLLMAGADKNIYARETANNLNIQWGAGQADYTNSLSILQGGEQSLHTVIAAGITATATTSLRGWEYGAINPNSQSAVIVHVTNAINGLTASLNWDVTQQQPDPAHIDTTDAGVIFPDLALELRPVTFSSGHYVLGASSSDVTLHSNASNDNVEYLYSTSALPADDYAFLISGDSTLATNVGFSYTIGAPLLAQWSSSAAGSWSASGNWSNGIPDSQTARALFLSSPGITAAGSIALDGNRTVGQITFSNTHSYSIDPGTGGTLTIDDTLDGIGNTPLITVSAGSHSITAPVSLAKGVSIDTAAFTALSITGNITGIGGLTKIGAGALTLSGVNNYGDTTLSAGQLTLASAASIASTNITVAAGATFSANGSLANSANLAVLGTTAFGANPSTGILSRPLASINMAAGSMISVSAAADHANRTILVSGSLTMAGSTDAWSSKLDLANNDLIVQNGNLLNLSNQLKQGFNIAAGFWNGSDGIVSSTAAANTTHLTALGAIVNNDGAGHAIYGVGAPLGLFDGQNPGLNDVLIKYTYFGDADLNGKVDGSDYTRIDNGFAHNLTGWFNGDFNYDGVIDGSDYSLIDNAFNTQGTTLADGAFVASSDFTAASLSGLSSPIDAGSGGAAVPEPASFGCFTAAGIASLLHRRRRQVV